MTTKEAEGRSTPERREGILPKRLVVKFGTKDLCSDEGGEARLDQAAFDDYARQIVELQRQGVMVVIVSSGAIQAGREQIQELQKQGIDVSQLNKKSIAGIGQFKLMERWDSAIKKAGSNGAAQLLVTYTNWSNTKERNNIRDSIFDWTHAGFITIVNENDPVADQEVTSWERRISENDRLTTMIANLINADAVLFSTDEGGIFTGDPQTDPEAKLVTEIPYRTASNAEQLGQFFGVSEKGVNQGMGAKWREASRCYRKRRRVAITGRREENGILRFARGEPVGTMIGTTVRIREA